MLLETERLYVRHLQLEDAKRMSEYRSKEEVARYQSWNSYSLQDAQKRINQCMQMTSWNQPKDNYHLAIVLKDNHIMIGDLFVEVVTRKVFALGYTLDSDYWLHGYATEVVSAFCDYMKNEYHFKKVVCYVYNDNIRSKKLLKRLHFMKFDESYYYDDEGYIKKLK